MPVSVFFQNRIVEIFNVTEYAYGDIYWKIVYIVHIDFMLRPNCLQLTMNILPNDSTIIITFSVPHVYLIVSVAHENVEWLYTENTKNHYFAKAMLHSSITMLTCTYIFAIYLAFIKLLHVCVLPNVILALPEKKRESIAFYIGDCMSLYSILFYCLTLFIRELYCNYV